MSGIKVDEFTPSVEIKDTDKISVTDNKIRTIMSESKNYMEAQTQNAVDQLEGKVNDKLEQVATDPNLTYSMEAIDAKFAAGLENNSTFNEINILDNKNKALVGPISFTRLSIGNNSTFKII